MKIEKSAALPVLCFVTSTSLKKLGTYVRTIARDLYKEAAAANLEVVGPVYWVYSGADGNPETEFELTIALPITLPTDPLPSGMFQVMSLPNFHFLSQRLEGPWELLGQTYGSLLAHIQNEGRRLSGENREVYLRMDFQNPENNSTEVQIGLIP